MRLPVPKFLATTESIIQFSDGTDENGDLKIIEEVNVKCRFEKSNSVAYTKEGVKVALQAKVYIFEKFDKFPDEVSGLCTAQNCTYDICTAKRLFNPDGSIHHIVLELI